MCDFQVGVGGEGGGEVSPGLLLRKRLAMVRWYNVPELAAHLLGDDQCPVFQWVADKVVIGSECKCNRPPLVPNCIGPFCKTCPGPTRRMSRDTTEKLRSNQKAIGQDAYLVEFYFFLNFFLLSLSR